MFKTCLFYFAVFVICSFLKHNDVHERTTVSPDINTCNEVDYICISCRSGTKLMDVTCKSMPWCMYKL